MLASTARPLSSAPPSLLSAPAPLARTRLVDTTDVEEARRAFSRIYAESTIERQRAPFGCTLDVVQSGAVNFVAGDWRGGGLATLPQGLDRYALTLTPSGSGSARGAQAGEEYTVVSGRRGALFSPGLASTIESSVGFRGRTLTLQRAALEDHLTTLTGRAPRGPIRFEVSVDLEDGPGATLLGVAQQLRREVNRPGASPLMIAALRDALFTALLTGTKHSESALFQPRSPRVAPGCVRRAEEYIEAHAAEPITLAALVAVAGVPARSLRAAFVSSRGAAPMEVLRQRRFDLARARLASAAPGTTVASVAAELGFGGAGRFSVAYRRRFGESPSETLARRLGRER